MDSDSIQKYKEIQELVGFLTDLISKTSGVIDSKLHQQISSITAELLTNYTAYMGALNLMVVYSSQVWMQRKLLKAKQLNESKPDSLEKFLESLKSFEQAARSVVKPLEYFSKIYNPKEAKKGVVNSLSGVLGVFGDHLDKLHDKYIKNIRTKSTIDSVNAGLVAGGLDRIDGSPIMVGGAEQIWIGGMQTQSLMTKHLIKMDLLKTESDEIVRPSLAQILGCTEDALDNVIKETKSIELSKLIQTAELDKPIKLIDWDKLESDIRKYIDDHVKRYADFISDEPIIFSSETSGFDIKKSAIGSCDVGLLTELESLDRKILTGMARREFHKMNNVKTADELELLWKELQENIKTISLHPNRRVEVFSELHHLYDVINQLEIKLEQETVSDSVPIDLIGIGSAATMLTQIVQAEQTFIPKMKLIEQLYVDLATNLGKAKTLWLELISDETVDTCIRWTGLILTSLIRLNLIEVLLSGRFMNDKTSIDTKQIIISEDHPRVSLYDGAIKLDKLEELIMTMI